VERVRGLDQSGWEGFSDDDRRTLVLAYCYEQERRRSGQWGYRVFQEVLPSAALASSSGHDAKMFRTFATVRKWIERGGWQVTWRREAWQGYVRHIFRVLAPTIPQPAQLKNPYLLERYLGQDPRLTPLPRRSRAELEGLYRRVVLPEFASLCGQVERFSS
jgi:hypothetical protein